MDIEYFQNVFRNVSYVLLLCIEHGSIVTCNICMSSILRLFFLIEKKDENNIYEKKMPFVAHEFMGDLLSRIDSVGACFYVYSTQTNLNEQTNRHTQHSRQIFNVVCGSWFWKSTKPCLSTSLLWLVGKESKGLLLLVDQANHQEVFILEVSWLFNKFL